MREVRLPGQLSQTERRSNVFERNGHKNGQGLSGKSPEWTPELERFLRVSLANVGKSRS